MKKLLLVLLAIFLLRLPSFFEPHWYGDEEIYLAIGQAVRRGAVLYRDIWDNKTPLLYWIYALSPTLLWAKLIATAAVLGTVGAMYKLGGKWVALAVGILLSLPFLEGNIANAELYFTFLIATAAVLIFSEKKPFLVGLLMAGAFLLKVPAVFDFVGLLLAIFSLKKLRYFFVVGVGFALPVISVFGYMYANNALADFMTAAFFQNASYVSIDAGPFSKLSNPLFIRALLLLLISFILSVLFIKKKISREFFIVTLWFAFSLYGALLSNRPYRHYLLQIVPPTTLLLWYVVTNFKKYFLVLPALLGIGIYLGKMFTGSFALDTLAYYKNFYAYASERISWKVYANNFDGHTLDNYRAAKFIQEKTAKDDPIFVWGDVASIYDLANRPAATKFIQAHHLSTVDPKNYDLIMARLTKYQPKIIVTVKPEQFSFGKLDSFLRTNYRIVANYGNLYLYQNENPISPPKWYPEPN